MALERVYTFKQREEILKTLLDMNMRAERVYNEQLRAGSPVNKAYLVADEIMQEAEDLAADLTWRPEATIKVDADNGIELFQFVSTGTINILTATGVPSGVYAFAQILASGDVIQIRNAENPSNNGEGAVSAVGARTIHMSRAFIANSADTTVELVLYQKAVA